MSNSCGIGLYRYKDKYETRFGNLFTPCTLWKWSQYGEDTIWECQIFALIDSILIPDRRHYGFRIFAISQVINEGTRLFTRKISTGKLMMWKGWSKIKKHFITWHLYYKYRIINYYFQHISGFFLICFWSLGKLVGM